MPGYGGSSSMAGAGIEMERYAQHGNKHDKHDKHDKHGKHGKHSKHDKHNETKEGFMDLMAMDVSSKLNIIIVLLGLLLAMKIHTCMKK